MSDETLDLDQTQPPDPAAGQPADEGGQPHNDNQTLETEAADIDEDGEDIAGEGEAGDDDDEAPAETAELAEIEIDGKTYTVPADLKDGYLREGDYTRKTQALGEERRQLEADREAVQQIAQVSQQELGLMAELQGMDQTLVQYANVDWRALREQDPLGADEHWQNYQLLKDQREGTARQYQQANQHRTQLAQQETAKRIEQTDAWAKDNIPGWSPDMSRNLIGFAEESGFSRETLQGALTPDVMNMLHLAYVGKQAMQRQAEMPRKTTPKKPLTTVKSKGSRAGQRPLTEMGMDEYAAHRNKQMGLR